MTVRLIGRIDSSNAADTEKKINDQIAGSDGDLVLDASDLTYISSAGLRVILRLKKTNRSAKVINCNSEVYEIFDMTGFTEMMDISKAYRKISVDGCEVVGEGANGVVYRTDPDTIVKVYKNPDSLAEIHNERELARKAFVMGIPTAIPYDVVQVGELYGSVFELLNAKSFAKLIREGHDVEALAKDSVDILKIMHTTMLTDSELPDKREEAIGWAKYCVPYLPEAIGKKLVGLFEAIPKTNNMLHGDYHIKNIMRQNDENLLIDMDTLSMGHPIFEFAAVFAAYEGFGCVDKTIPSVFLGITTDQCLTFLDATFRFYFAEKSAPEIEHIRKSAAMICYARILRRCIRKFGLDDPVQKPVIEFCKRYLTENVPVTDKLFF